MRSRARRGRGARKRGDDNIIITNVIFAVGRAPFVRKLARKEGKNKKKKNRKKTVFLAFTAGEMTRVENKGGAGERRIIAGCSMKN